MALASINNSKGESMSEESKKDDITQTGTGGCGCCPLAQIPAKVWRTLLRPPFRKRHPIIFWLGMICLIVLLAVVPRRLFSDQESMGRDCIALVAIQGPILDSASTLAWIGRIENNPEVKGVLVRVNSPGGGASASQEIYSALARVGKKIPVVASMGATAASGGLMIAMAGERVFANPSTVTGSIGVRMDIPQLEGLMSKIGVGQETLVTAPYKDAASYMRPLTPRDREYLEGVLMNMHEQFVNIVATGRHMEHDRAAALANGKIYTGEEALQLGLVDELGGEYEAIQWLAQKTGVPGNRKLLKKTDNTSAKLLDRLLGLASMLFLDGAADKMAEMEERWTRPAFLYQFF